MMAAADEHMGRCDYYLKPFVGANMYRTNDMILYEIFPLGIMTMLPCSSDSRKGSARFSHNWATIFCCALAFCSFFV